MTYRITQIIYLPESREFENVKIMTEGKYWIIVLPCEGGRGCSYGLGAL